MSLSFSHKSGFTLVELSIVLVIIALLVSGIVAGREMIENANQKKFVTFVEDIKSFTNAFRLKYNCLPGDCPNATQFFGNAGGTGDLASAAGALNGTCTTPADTNRGATGTCNGNGNSKISTSGGWGSGDEDSSERYSMWQHLALAKYIQGEYGVLGTTISYAHEGGVNVPNAPYKKGMIVIARTDNSNDMGNNRMFSTSVIGKHSLVFASYLEGGGIPSSILMPPEARLIDTKFDDGFAFSGTITAGVTTGSGLGCTTPSAVYDISADYTTSGANSSQVKCMLAFDYIK